MSNALAIAAVTTTLRTMLFQALSGFGADVTTLPPDRARATITGDQLNIFLYNTSVDSALRNTPPPTSKPGESAEPALPLRLYYLLTAYGQSDNDEMGHQLLGHVMSVLHDHPLLGRQQIFDATAAGPLPGSDLHTQVERVRITPLSLNLEEMSKLWMTFQTQFRISAAYEVSVVLIDSARPSVAALPVLGRGSEADSGFESVASVESPFPSLLSAESPDPSALLPGETLVLRGANLSGTNVAVRIRHQLMGADRVLAPLPGATATELSVVIPDEPADLPAGIYTVAVDVEAEEAAHPGITFTRTTNRLAFARAPVITSAMPTTEARDGLGHVSMSLTCSPDVQPGQRASLLLGGREIPAQPFNAATSTLDFEFDNPTPADAPDPVESFARLRVDGVDSLLMDRTVTPPVFRNDQKVTIT